MERVLNKIISEAKKANRPAGVQVAFTSGGVMAGGLENTPESGVFQLRTIMHDQHKQVTAMDVFFTADSVAFVVVPVEQMIEVAAPRILLPNNTQ